MMIKEPARLQKRDGKNYRVALLFWLLNIGALYSFVKILFSLLLAHSGVQYDKLLFGVFLYLCFQVPITVWFIRDACLRHNMSTKKRRFWVAFLVLAGFIASAFYYDYFFKEKGGII